jgi:hypothetical protein
MNVEFRLGHGAINRFACRFNENYLGAPTVAYTRKPTNLPDWTMRVGSGAVEPWSLRLPLDVAWSYDGVRDLVWEVVWDGSTATGSYTTDRASGSGSVFSSSTGTVIGTGCTATGRTSAFSLTTIGYTHLTNGLMRLRVSASNAPSTAPLTLMADAVNSNLTVPGLCATVIALPVLQVALGTSSATGALAALDLHLPWLPALQTTPVYLQAITVDPGQPGLPLALTQGRRQQWPAAPTTPGTAAYTYSTDVTGATLGSGPFTAGSAICGFER